ncbi:MAG: MFS transporter [Bacteroidota bacterium]
MKILLSQDVPFKPYKFPINYGWVILIVGILGVIMSIPGQTMGVSVFTDYLIDALQIERLHLSNAYLIGTLLSATLLTRVGRLYDRYGSRLVAMAAALVLAGTLILISFSSNIARYISTIFSNRSSTYVAFGVITVCFFLLRFSGQGVLTMVSRTMLMKWFVENRGFANGLSGIAVSFGFSVAPGIFNTMIEASSWQQTLWQLALAALGFVLFAFTFFRDNPKDSNCQPDGGRVLFATKNKKKSLPSKDFSLKEARGTFVFWVFSLTIALLGLYGTAITFHIADIFEKANMSRATAFSIFVPSAFVALFFHFSCSWLSDFIELKYLLYLELLAIGGSAFAVLYLADFPFCFYLLIFCNGMFGGLNGVLMNVSWPRFFGLTHLGAISGFAMSLTVGGSALGPAIFSFAESYSDNYDWACYTVLGVVAILLTLGLRLKAT